MPEKKKVAGYISSLILQKSNSEPSPKKSKKTPKEKPAAPETPKSKPPTTPTAPKSTSKAPNSPYHKHGIIGLANDAKW